MADFRLAAVALLILSAPTFRASSAPAPVFRAVVTSGWNEKPPVEFIVEPDRTFVWRSGSEERKGSIGNDALAALIRHVQAAQPGPAANDVGTLQVTWREKSGAKVSKVFYFPGNPPASELLKEIDALAAPKPAPGIPAPPRQ
ncbi:MAG: hypothetical protein JWO80_900 [Bryobacterales bacterium]|nr:hypothetical protein [Bryobacterales bacterium]